MLKKLAIVFGIGFLVLLLLVGGALIWFSHDASKALAEAKAGLVEDGAPFSIEQVLPEVDDADNAAPLYLELDAYVEEHPSILAFDDSLEGLIPDEDLDPYQAVQTFQIEPELWPEIGKLLSTEDFEGYFNRIEQIAEKPSFKPDWNYDAGPAMLVPEVGIIKRAADRLLMKAAYSIHMGQDGDAARYLYQTLRLSEHVGQGDNLICLLTSVATQKMAYRFQQAASWQSQNWHQAGLGNWNLKPSERWIASMDMERLGLASPFFEAIIEGDYERLLELSGGEVPSLQLKTASNPLVVWFFKYDYAAYLTYMRKARQLQPEALGAFADFEERFQEEVKKHRHLLTAIVTPAVRSMYDHVIAAEARNELVRTSSALEAYKTIAGQYPDSIEALTPQYLDQIPMDPFSQAPLHYRKEGNAFTLYSIGTNLVDDGGSIDEEDTNWPTEGDIVWTGRGSVPHREQSPGDQPTSEPALSR
ncbi:hypothetical protein [Coraliomargarita parva]|uniref:hypothetical protein n=1 Tax=Coraliomargarita parva TaxID=3014050 RepID=UPI0022B4EB38|nr:hypothetical protein [Coraliomargarita parva]